MTSKLTLMCNICGPNYGLHHHIIIYMFMYRRTGSVIARKPFNSVSRAAIGGSGAVYTASTGALDRREEEVLMNRAQQPPSKHSRTGIQSDDRESGLNQRRIVN